MKICSSIKEFSKEKLPKKKTQVKELIAQLYLSCNLFLVALNHHLGKGDAAPPFEPPV